MVLAEAILEFPDMIKCMPGRAADGKSWHLVKSIAAMRGMLLPRSNRTKSQKHLLTHLGFLLSKTIPIDWSSRWSTCRQMHEIGLYQVQSHRERRTPAFRFSIEMSSHMDENHQDKTESKPTATEVVGWVRNKKSKLWVPKYKKRTGLEDATRIQSLTQIIGVIVIPLSILLGIAEFSVAQQHTLQRSIDAQQQGIQQNYLGNMSDLLLKQNLRGSKSQDVVRQVAEVETLLALENLNPARKRLVVRFLYESGLILSDHTSKTHPIITLNSADLSGADLSGVNLSGANLSGADLNGANLSGANLSGALVTQEQLDRAKSLQGATMPDGSKHS